MPPGLVLLITVAAIATGVWLAYAIRRAIRRNDRTRDERLHHQQKSWERWAHTYASPSPRPPQRSKPRQPPQPAVPRPPPRQWWFDKEIEEREARERADNSPELDGNEIMRILGIPPGPGVGRASKHLLQFRRDHGDQGKDAATAELLRWWKGQAR